MDVCKALMLAAARERRKTAAESWVMKGSALKLYSYAFTTRLCSTA